VAEYGYSLLAGFRLPSNQAGLKPHPGSYIAHGLAQAPVSSKKQRLDALRLGEELRECSGAVVSSEVPAACGRYGVGIT
jgi:hypothetical protein